VYYKTNQTNGSCSQTNRVLVPETYCTPLIQLAADNPHVAAAK